MTCNPSHVGLILVLLGTGGCSAVTDFDGYTYGDERDAGPDSDVGGGPDGATSDASRDGEMADAVVPEGGLAVPPTVVVQTSGGAVLMSSEYRLRISVGAPQPMGSRQSGSYRITMGPESVQ